MAIHCLSIYIHHTHKQLNTSGFPFSICTLEGETFISGASKVAKPMTRGIVIVYCYCSYEFKKCL